MNEKKILIVDDVAKNIQVAANFLKEQGYKLLFATSGDKALKTLEEKEVDLILLDIMMPGIDGFEVAKKVKSTTKTKDIPIVFVTAKSDEESIKKGFKVGGVDYITKPFNQEELIARVRNHMELSLLQKELKTQVELEVAKREKAQETLIQTSKMADMGDMIGAIAHQWKQPLNSMGIVVQEAAELAKVGEYSQEDLELCSQKVMEKIKFMSDTVGDFRNYFKVDKKFIQFNGKDAVLEVYNMLCPQFKKSEIEVVIVESEDTTVYGVRNEFKQVILNLLNNARDNFLEKKLKDAKVSISFAIEDEFLKVSLLDNGGGVPDELISKIFDQNFTTKEDGNGIGLYMCKTIIEEHLGGKISVANQDGGAVFTLLVPRKADGNQIIT